MGVLVFQDLVNSQLEMESAVAAYGVLGSLSSEAMAGLVARRNFPLLRHARGEFEEKTSSLLEQAFASPHLWILIPNHNLKLILLTLFLNTLDL